MRSYCYVNANGCDERSLFAELNLSLFVDIARRSSGKIGIWEDVDFDLSRPTRPGQDDVNSSAMRTEPFSMFGIGRMHALGSRQSHIWRGELRAMNGT